MTIIIEKSKVRFDSGLPMSFSRGVFVCGYLHIEERKVNCMEKIECKQALNADL
jgi:hypothetical protein